MTLIISIGKWGGFYCNSHRLCLGFVAVTFYYKDFDDLFDEFLDYIEFTRGK